MKARLATRIGLVALGEWEEKCPKAPIDRDNTKRQGRHEKLFLGATEWEQATGEKFLICDHCGEPFSGRIRHNTLRYNLPEILSQDVYFWDYSLPEIIIGITRRGRILMQYCLQALIGTLTAGHPTVIERMTETRGAGNAPAIRQNVTL